jgi:hypothetical protein
MTVAAPQHDLARPRLASAAYVLDVFFVVVLAMVLGLVAAGERGGETVTSNLLLSIPALGAVIAALAGGVVAALALRGDRPASVAGRFALRGTVALLPAFALAVAVGSLWESAQTVLAVALNAAMLAIPAAAVYARVARKDRAGLLVVPLVVGVIVTVWLLFELTLTH